MGKIRAAPRPKRPIDRLNMTNASAMLKIEIQSGVGGAEQQHNVDQIERQAERGNEIEHNEVQPLKGVRKALQAMEKAQFAIRHETDSQSIAIPARALAQKAYPADRAVCFGPGFRHETDEVAQATQPQAVLQILAGADVEAALPQVKYRVDTWNRPRRDRRSPPRRPVWT